MNLLLPTVGGEPGPNYAFDVNNSLSIIDSHNHTPGSGVQITPAGLNINTSLTFQSNAATNVGYIGFFAQNASLSTIQTTYSAPASSINELWYTDSNGTATQITKNGVVNSVASSIPGQSYAAGTFIWVQGSGSITPANFDIGSIIIRPTVAGTTYGVELSPPSAISSEYAISLPLVPATTSVLTLSNSGVMGNLTASTQSYNQYIQVPAGSTTPQFAQLKIPTQTIFTGTSSNTSGTYTPPAQAIWLKVTVVGGGGGGGAGANAGGSSGSAGGNSTFGSIITANGGGGGSGASSSSPGNAGSGGSASLSGSGWSGYSNGGGDGFSGIANAGTNPSGNGGASIMGGGGRGGFINSDGQAGSAYGSGGGGAGPQGGSNECAGGGGAGASAIIYINTILSTYSYVAGAYGAGASGTRNGANGAPGIIIIEEYY